MRLAPIVLAVALAAGCVPHQERAARAADGATGEGPACTSNDDCGEGRYCARPEGGCDDPGRCATRPEACTQIYAPVCGCDGRTYGNACTAAAKGVNVDFRGECEPRDPDELHTDE